jgi:hypothetical protein
LPNVGATSLPNVGATKPPCQRVKYRFYRFFELTLRLRLPDDVGAKMRELQLRWG